ncbi:TetR/AcrR family transcriptional regulator [Kribbella sp. NPDC055071]
MARWEPGATDRLRTAAMELYVERGYDNTTVAEIADRAGVTARTFFRHFADKKEVLFQGAGELEKYMVAGLTAAPASATPMEAVTAGLLASGDLFGLVRREFSRQRQVVIDATPELQERELIKMASLTAAFADALRARGVDPEVAALAAETGIAVFRVAFARWLSAPEGATMADAVRSTLTTFSGLTA